MAECYRKWYQHAKVLLLQNLKYVTLASKSSSKEIVAGHSKNSDWSYGSKMFAGIKNISNENFVQRGFEIEYSKCWY